MAGRRWIVGGAVVVALVIVGAGSVGWAQQPPRAKVEPVAVPTPAVPVPPPKGALPLRLELPQAAPLRTAGALAMPTPPAGVFGIVSSASGGGGIFSDTANDAATWLGSGGYGIQAFGNTAAGYFQSANKSGYAYVGYGDYGIQAYGRDVGVYATASVGASGTAGSFSGWIGVQAYGTNYGGYFANSTSSPTGWATLGAPGKGVEAYGTTYAGYFAEVPLYAWARLGCNYTGGAFYGVDYGIFATAVSGVAGYFAGWHGVEAYGTEYGGYFKDSTPTHTGWAKVGFGHYGLQAYGRDVGVYATASVGNSGTAGSFSGWIGVQAYGTTYGGNFVGTGAGTGIYATAASGLAGYFTGANGIQAWGTTAGGFGVYGYNSNTGTYSYLGKGTYKVFGSGSVSFAQNHPNDRSRVIVYSAPEGDEVATYTRGTARLVNGEARVPLGATFALVTNPDLGLTVYLTPVGDWSDLYVAEKTTSSIVVRSVHGPPDAAFDYIVWGLRIGFEEVGVVQEKEQEAYIPAMTTHEQLFQKHPELHRYTALARYQGDRAQILGAKALGLDLSASEKLKAAIGVFVPGVTPIDKGGKQVALQGTNRPVNVAQTGTGTIENRPGAEQTTVSTTAGEPQVVRAVIEPAADAYGRSFHSPQRELAYVVSVDDTVEPGDVLVAASDRPGVMRRAVTEGDPAVVGVVAAAPGVVLGEAADPTAASERSQAATGHADLAVSGIVRCKVDASYGPLRVGDLLVTSATPGHARVAKSPAPGTVVGKALEALEAGTGAINVLVMLR